MATIIFPKALKVPNCTGMVRSILEGTEEFPYELKITLNEPSGADKNMYIYLTDSEVGCILYHLEALGLIKEV